MNSKSMKQNGSPELILVLNQPDPLRRDVSLAVPIAPFAQGYPAPFQAEEWPALRQTTRNSGQKLYAMLPGFIMEEQLPALDSLIRQLLDADGIYYGDEAVYMAAKAAGYEGLLIFQPDTLVCSSADVKTLQRMGADVVSLAHELSLEEVLQIVGKTGGLEIQIQGYYPVLTSRRRLSSAYGQETGNPRIGPGVFELQESTRSSWITVLEQEAGTVLFSPEAVSSLKQLPQLQAAGIDRMRIDSRFLTPEQRDRTVALCQAVLQGKAAEDDCIGSDAIWHRQSVKTKGESL